MSYIDMLNVAVVLAIVFAVILTGAAVFEEFDRQKFADHQEAAESWCSEYDGELAYGDGMGVHAQTHCYTANGTTVHMGEIAAMDYTHDWEQIRDRPGATHANTPAMGLLPTTNVVGAAFIVASLAGAVGVVRRFRGPKTEKPE